MQLTTLLTTTALTSLSAAFPAPPTKARATTGESKGFNLRVNVTDPTRDLTPSMQGLYFGDLRAGAGIAVSQLTATATPFYLNGTAYHTTITHDIAGVYPLSIVVAGPASYDALYPAEHPIGTAVNGGTELFLRAGEPVLFPLDDGGVYAACSRDVVLGGGVARLLTARYVYGDETVPADCAPVEFVVECAVLPDLPEGSSWDHDFAFDVPCVIA
ncbi:hypothetical protein F5Y12DRAFT_99069 [Xylaria sp. FL1777]|nr:hypothetical protein F5Y12DRAFT_99069 [Xylaria sp. FL1777]